MAGGAVAQQQAAQGPSKVGVITMTPEDVPYSITLPGRAIAYEQADIRPRVEGMVTAIPYAYGQPAKKGDVLFKIEPDTYEAELAAAEADVSSAQASVQTAQSAYDRYSQIEGIGVTKSDLETAAATLASSKATLKSAEAALQTAQLNLDRTSIVSPIDGVVEVPEVSVGTLVTANQTDILTTVTRLDPIYVDVSESSAQMQRHRNWVASGELTLADQVGVSLTLETGEQYSGSGRMISPSAVVSDTTGTVDFRIEFDNPDGKILPGQFLRASLTLGTKTAVLVPQNATQRSADGTLSAFIAKDGTAQKTPITTSGSYDNAWVVTSGIEQGDLLIVDGLKTLQDGAAITTVAVTIDADGVVHDVDGDTAADGATDAPAAGSE
ncbi:efflux transporter periplasmic adaptor subunit [Thioclava sp. SK-1]|nr:efflux transporter periplasmic adaptor subunit [Thioclava sp. SK-1]